MIESDHNKFDVAIFGGGLAGLSASILLARTGLKVVLLEKEKYPFHKVCGEYISLESWNFLKELGLPLDKMNLPLINSLLLTAMNGKSFQTQLPLGGFGISRYLLDSSLAEIAIKLGVIIYQETKVDDVHFKTFFSINYNSQMKGPGSVSADICCAAYGKKSNLDIKWKRKFLDNHDKKLNNYIGIKYHLINDWKSNLIGLHNFKDGYCGISRIEDNKYCLCYMTKAENLKQCNNSIQQLQENILYQNPYLKKIFSESTILKDFPVTISQISFNKKTQVHDHILMLGDSAGMITPLCGNGMSMALHSAKISTSLITEYFKNHISREQLEKKYQLQWKKQFAKRLYAGRVLQKLFGSNRLSNGFVKLLNIFPFLASPLVKMTHGKEF